jgi:UV DNA damage endonuclease
MRLGFVAISVARPELKSHDGRRWQNQPHLSVSLAYLRDMFAYLAEAGIHMYRMSSDLAPYATHPDLPQFHNQVAECQAELAALGAMARGQDLRLSFHPGQHVVLNSPDPALVAHSAADLIVQAGILDAMGLGPEAVVVTHMGGVYEDRGAARARFGENYARLPAAVQARLVLENDDVRFGVADTLWVHTQTGIRLVFDNLHHRLLNPDNLPPLEALALALATWPDGVRPKIHWSSPRTELNVEKTAGGGPPHIRPPRWNNHADYVNPFECIDFLRAARGLRPFDMMLEVRAKDLALLRLRRDLARYAPDLRAEDST